MVSSGRPRREMIFDSEDEDYFADPLSAASFENLHNEMDIERYCRKLSNMKIIGSRASMQSRRHKKSKHVQTDPEISDVPASWLLEGGKLVEEMYTGLGNIINAMYHSQESCASAKETKESAIDQTGMKYFKYDNGYWHSTLLRDIKIPARIGMDRLNQPFFSEDTKRKLHSLFNIATKLRNMVPYVTNAEPLQNSHTTEDMVQCCSNEKSFQELERNISPLLGAHPSNPSDCNMDLPSDSFENCSDSGKSSLCSPEYYDMETKRVRIENSLETVSERNAAVQNDHRRFDQIPGVHVFKLKQVGSLARGQNSEPGVSNSLKSREMGAKASNSKRGGLCIVGKSVHGITPASNITAGCSKDYKISNKSNVHKDIEATRRREKDIFYGQENCKQNKPHHTGSQINFIKRNIMAAKSKGTYHGSSAGSSERYNSETSKSGQNVIPRTVSQNLREKMRNPLR